MDEIMFKVEKQIAKENMKQRLIKNAIGASDFGQKRLFSQSVRDRAIVFPDEIFTKWIRTTEYTFSLADMLCLIERKQDLDKYIDSVKKACIQDKYEELCLNQLEILLTDNNLERKPSHFVYLLNLMSNFELDAVHLLYPVKNLFRNYKSLETCIDQLVCDAAYLADHKILNTLFTALIMKSIPYKFLPSSNERHGKVMNWIKKNISRAEEFPNAALGWCCGPDSARWPSTQLDDYKKTLMLLNDVIDK